jgi:hypothetical protein
VLRLPIPLRDPCAVLGSLSLQSVNRHTPVVLLNHFCPTLAAALHSVVLRINCILSFVLLNAGSRFVGDSIADLVLRKRPDELDVRVFADFDRWIGPGRQGVLSLLVNQPCHCRLAIRHRTREIAPIG